MKRPVLKLLPPVLYTKMIYVDLKQNIIATDFSMKKKKKVSS